MFITSGSYRVKEHKHISPFMSVVYVRDYSAKEKITFKL